VLFGLGIRHVGATIAEKLVQVFPSIEKLKSATFDELIAVPEIGDRIAQSVRSFLSIEQNISLIERLKAAGIQFEEEIKEIVYESRALDGKSFVISGVFKNFERDDLKVKIISNGGKVLSSISSKLDYLVAGDNMGPSKLEKAQQLNIKIINEDEFLALIS
jgi:DNA ligase (NAD+)